MIVNFKEKGNLSWLTAILNVNQVSTDMMLSGGQDYSSKYLKPTR